MAVHTWHKGSEDATRATHSSAALLLCSALLLLILHPGFCEAEADVFIVNPAPGASLQSGFFELEFVAVWQVSNHRALQLHAIIGGGYATAGGYYHDLSHLLHGLDGLGEHSASAVLRTPPHQVVVAIGLLLVDENGERLAFAGHEVNVSPSRPVASSCLLSYAGSGNHLMRFMLEFITLRPTLGLDYFKDLALAENEYREGNPLSEVDLLAQPCSEKFHTTKDYFPFYDDTRDFHQRCVSKLILLMRDFHEVIPRFINAIRDENEDDELWQIETLIERIEVEVRVFLDNVRAFVEFSAPKLLINYATLKKSPSAVAVAAGSFLGVEERRVREWARRADELAQQCLTGEGRQWQGQRSAGPQFRGSHLSGWRDEEASALFNVSARTLKGYSAEVQALCEPSLHALLASLYRRNAPNTPPLHAL